MKKKHIYTLPEEFIKDPAVPARWKILATLQGFWFSGNTFYGTNEWIEKEMGYSRRQVQFALNELEELGLITRNVKGMRRTILPGGVKPDFTLGCSPTSPRGEARLHHNSDNNNSVNKHSEPSSQNYQIVPDVEEGKAPRKPKSRCYEVFEVFREVTGKYPLNWQTNRTQRQSAENLYQERGLEQIRKALEFHRETKSEPFSPAILTPYDLDSKWSKLSEFKKKHYGD